MKQRHFKSLEQRYGTHYTNRKELDEAKSLFLKNLRFYYNKINKEKSNFNLNDALNFCGIMTKGIFYMKALCEQEGAYYLNPEFGAASYILFEDTLPRSQKLCISDNMEYTKFYIFGISEDKWCYLLYFDLYNNLDYTIIETGKITINGNIGILNA